MVKVELGKKDLVWVALFIAVVGLGFVIAYNPSGTGNPSVMGHSANEIQGVCLSDGTNCPAGFGAPSILSNTTSGIRLPGGSYTVLIWASYSVSPEGTRVYLRLDGNDIASKVSWYNPNPDGIGTPTIMAKVQINDTNSHTLSIGSTADLYAKSYMWIAVKN